MSVEIHFLRLLIYLSDDFFSFFFPPGSVKIHYIQNGTLSDPTVFHPRSLPRINYRSHIVNTRPVMCIIRILDENIVRTGR